MSNSYDYKQLVFMSTRSLILEITRILIISALIGWHAQGVLLESNRVRSCRLTLIPYILHY